MRKKISFNLFRHFVNYTFVFVYAIPTNIIKAIAAFYASVPHDTFNFLYLYMLKRP